MEQQSLRPQGDPLIRHLLVVCALIVDRADVVSLGGGEVRLRAVAFVSGERIGERSRLVLPYPSLDIVLAGQSEGYGGGEIAMQGLIVQWRFRPLPSSRVELIAVSDKVAGVRDNRLGAADLGGGRLP